MRLYLTRYQLTNELIEDDVKLINIADLHSEIEPLLNLRKVIKEENVDVVVFSGDAFDTQIDSRNKEIADIICEMSKEIIVIFATGNHENYHKSKKNYVDYLRKKSKCIMLDDYKKGYIYNSKIRFYSINMEDEWYHGNENSIPFINKLLKFYFDSKYFNILVSHTPNPLVSKNGMCLEIPNVNLVLCGHNHGGMTLRFIRRLSKKKRGFWTAYNKRFRVGAYDTLTNGVTNIDICGGITKVSKINMKSILLRKVANTIFYPESDTILLKNGENSKIRKYKGKLYKFKKSKDI